MPFDIFWKCKQIKYGGEHIKACLATLKGGLWESHSEHWIWSCRFIFKYQTVNILCSNAPLSLFMSLCLCFSHACSCVRASRKGTQLFISQRWQGRRKWWLSSSITVPTLMPSHMWVLQAVCLRRACQVCSLPYVYPPGCITHTLKELCVFIYSKNSMNTNVCSSQHVVCLCSHRKGSVLSTWQHRRIT